MNGRCARTETGLELSRAKEVMVVWRARSIEVLQELAKEWGVPQNQVYGERLSSRQRTYGFRSGYRGGCSRYRDERRIAGCGSGSVCAANRYFGWRCTSEQGAGYDHYFGYSGYPLHMDCWTPIC